MSKPKSFNIMTIYERKESMQKNKQDKEMTLSGYVAASEWDAGDNVVAINILTDDEEYDVELNELGVELCDFLDEDVEVTGILKKGRKGTKLLKVTNYKPLENRGYDREDDDYEYDSEKDLDSGGESAKFSADEPAKFPILLNFMKQAN